MKGTMKSKITTVGVAAQRQVDSRGVPLPDEQIVARKREIQKQVKAESASGLISDFVEDAQRWSVSYAEIESILARLHGADGDVQKKAFRGRLKHLKRLGIPRGINPGKGAKVWYKEAQLYEWAFCLELAEFGLDPTAIVRLMEQKFKDDILPHLVEARLQRDSDDLYFVASPSLMSAAWQSKEPLPYRWLKSSDAAIWLDRMGHSRQKPRRAILINVTVMCNAIGLLGVMVEK